MLRNKRSPYVMVIAILVSLSVLILLGIKGAGGMKHEEEYEPVAQLSADREQSYFEPTPLPLTYSFTSMPYKVDVMQAAYSQAQHGIAGIISDGAFLYVGEYSTKEGTGLTVTLDDLPGNFINDYNRSGSFITPKMQSSGYLQGFGTDYCFCQLSIAGTGAAKDYMAAVFDIHAEDEKGVVVAVMIDSKSRKKKAYAMESAMAVASTIREDTEWAEHNESRGNQAALGLQDEERAALVAEGIAVEMVEPEKSAGSEQGPAETVETQEATHDSEWAGRQETAASEPTAAAWETEPTEVPENESEPVSSVLPGREPVPDEKPSPEPEPLPPSEGEPAPAREEPSGPPAEADMEPASAEDPDDVSIKSFTCPLAGVGMSVTVTTGSYCPDTIVTMETPDGEILAGTPDGAGTYTFSTTSTDGTYTVKTTHFSEVRQVSVSAHFGG